MLRKNVASQVVTFSLVNATTGAALTGATVTVKVTLDGTQSSGSGTVTELGTGQYKYVPTQAETNGSSVGFGFTATNAVPVNLHCFTIGQDPAAAQFAANVTQFGGTNATTASGRPEVNLSHIAGSAVSTSSAQIGVNVVNFGGSAGTFTSGKPDVQNVAGNVTGSVGSVTGSVGSVTGAVGSVTGAVGSIASGGITRASFAADTGLQSVRSNTAQAGAAGTITLDASASATTDYYVGALVYLTGGTGVGQARIVTAYNGTTKVATITPNWATAPDATSTFAVLAGDWPKVDSSLQVTAASVQGNVTGSVGSVTGNIGGSVASVTAGVTVTTNNDKTGYALTAAYDAAKTAAQAGDTMKVSSGTGAGQISLSSGQVTVGTNNDKTGYSVASGGIGSGAHAAAELNAIADALLDRNMATGTDSGTDSTSTRTPRQALRALRNKVAIAAGTMDVKKEDDSTSSWTAAVTTTAGNPVSSVDPT